MNADWQVHHAPNKATECVSAPRAHFAAVVAVGFVLRLVVALIMLQRDQNIWLFNQATELGCLAQSVLAGHGLASPFCGSTGPSAFLAPGYPFFVASIFRMFGAYSKHSAAAIVGCQTFFGLLLVLSVMLLTRRIFGCRAANIVGAICAASPTMVWLPEVFWETSLSIVFLTGTLTLALYCVDRPTRFRWAAAGLFCALATLVNPALVLTLAAIAAWATYETRKARVSLAGPLVGFVTWALVFAAWPIRNELVLHTFVPLRSNLGYELWQGNRPGSDGEFDLTLHPNGNRIERTRYAKVGDVAYMREKSTLAMAAIEADPARFARLSARRFFQFWTGTKMQGGSPFLVASLSFTTVTGFTGLMLLARRRPSYAVLLALPFVIFPLPYYFTHADFRFRLLLDPIAIMLGTYAVQRLLWWLQKTLVRQPWVAPTAA